MEQTGRKMDLWQGSCYVHVEFTRDSIRRIKSEYPDGTGFDLFDQWSASDPDRYNPKDVKATWRSVKAGGGVGVATLLHLAKEHGFTLPKGAQAPQPPSAEELAQRERERAQRQQAEQVRTDAAQAAAAQQAAEQWQDASDTGESPYLVRKGVQPHGVRFADGGVLLVPLRDGAGKLWNVQRIAPTKPENGAPEKLFLKGGRKSGLWHLVGELASGADATGPTVLLIAEGYATAATLHEATGYPVAVAFDAGNLQHVARALRQLHPAALLAVCGDDDQDTEKQTGTNPGRVKAAAAARAVHGLALFSKKVTRAFGNADFSPTADFVTNRDVRFDTARMARRITAATKSYEACPSQALSIVNDTACANAARDRRLQAANAHPQGAPAFSASACSAVTTAPVSPDASTTEGSC